MKTRTLPGFFFVIPLVMFLLLVSAWLTPAGAMQVETPSATPSGFVTVTVTYDEAVNVRAGPNSVYYPVVGSLPVGAVVQALGKSPGGEWIKIAFPEAQDGSQTGWVYTALVTLSQGFLPMVEPPPTVIPIFKPTINPDFVASLQPAPTSTRLATFTAPPPLEVPTYELPAQARGGLSGGMIALFLALLGFLGVLITKRPQR